MNRLFRLISALLICTHGLIHLMGFFVYWPLTTSSVLPYKTTFLNGLVDVGVIGTRGFSLLWLAAALGFITIAIALFAQWSSWQKLLPIMVGVSLIATIADWQVGFLGAYFDLLIMAAYFFTSRTTRPIHLRGK